MTPAEVVELADKATGQRRLLTLEDVAKLSRAEALSAYRSCARALSAADTSARKDLLYRFLKALGERLEVVAGARAGVTFSDRVQAARDALGLVAPARLTHAQADEARRAAPGSAGYGPERPPEYRPKDWPAAAHAGSYERPARPVPARVPPRAPDPRPLAGRVASAREGLFGGPDVDVRRRAREVRAALRGEDGAEQVRERVRAVRAAMRGA